MATGPSAYVIMPDPTFGLDKLVTITSEEGEFVGPGVPATTNEGDLVPQVEGTPESDTDFDLQMLRAGGLYVGAEWAWKQDANTNTQWRGYDDRRFLHGNHEPWSANRSGFGLEVLVSKTFNRVLLFRINVTGDAYDVVYRDLGADPFTWSTATFTPTRTSSAGSAKLVGYELPDGALRLLVRYGTSSAGDFDTYSSTNGGLTWTRVAVDVIQTWTALGTETTHRVVGDISGDWMRLCWADIAGKLQTLVSSDRGASWTDLTEIPSATTIYTTGHAVDPYGHVAVVGIDDRAGTFLLLLRETATSGDFRAYTAQRDEEWAYDSSLTFGSTLATNVYRAALFRTTSHIIHFRAYDDGATASYWRMSRIRRDDPLTNAVWEGSLIVNALAGSQKYVPANVVAELAGDRVVLLHGLVDPDSGGSDVTGTVVHQLQGWHRRTLNSSATYLWTDAWQNAYGPPAGASASPDTPWTETITAAGTRTWTSQAMTVNTPGAADAIYWALNEGLSPSDRWVDDSCFHYYFRLVSGSTVGSDRAAVRIVGSSATAGQTTDVSIRYSTDTVVIRDNVLGANVGTITGVSLGNTYYRWIWAQTRTGSTNYAELAYALPGDNVWSNLTGLTLSGGASPLTQAQLVRWGHLASLAAGITTDWRSFEVRGDNDLDQYGWVNPTNLRGKPLDPNPSYMDEGLYVRWGGGGGFAGDTYDVNLQHQYGQEALFTASPQMQWRSTSAVTQQLIFDAGVDDSGLGRFTHDGIALFGTATRRFRVQYNASNSWGSPSFALTVSADLFTGLTVLANSGAEVQLNSNGGWQDGELIGTYLVVEDGSASAGNSAKVLHHAGNRLVVGNENGTRIDADGRGFIPGTTVALYADHAAAVYSQRQIYRFARILFLDHSAQSRATTDHRIGAPVAGLSYRFDVPVEWAHADVEEGNSTIETLRGGMRVSHREGPARRALSVRLAGDTVRARERFRFLVDHLADYDDRPLALVLDDGSATRQVATALYARYRGPTALENEAWAQDSNSIERPAGDMALLFEEEV